jgi:hypothetical protein
MGGVELTDTGLVVGRDPDRLDTLAIDFSRILSRLGIDHVFVAGYVAILAGRSRSTEDIDVFIEITRRIPRPLRSGRKPTTDDANHMRWQDRPPTPQ